MKFVTAVVNNPKYIEVQYHTLKKYVKGDYEFIVFNDAKDWPDFTNFNDITIKMQIQKTCEALGITCINIPNEHHKYTQLSPSQKTGESCNYMMKYMKENPDRYFIIDSDMFLIAPLDPLDYDEFQTAIVLQERYNMFYPWNGLFYIDVNKVENIDLIDWSPTEYENLHCDTGGGCRKWLSLLTDDIHPTAEGLTSIETIRFSPHEYASEKIYYIKHLWANSWDESDFPPTIDKKYLEVLKQDPRNKDTKFCCEIYDNKFLHIQGGGRWDNGPEDLYETLTNLSLKLIN